MPRSALAYACASVFLLACNDDPAAVLDGPVNETLDREDQARWRRIDDGACSTSFERVGLVAEDVAASTTAGFDSSDAGCGEGGGVFVRGHDGQAFACALLVLTGPLPMDFDEGEALPPDYAEASLVLGRLDLETGAIDGIAYDGGSTNMDPATVTIEAEGDAIRCRAEGAGDVYEASAEDPDPALGTSGLIEDRVSYVQDLSLRPIE